LGLEDKSCGKLNLARGADGREYPAGIIGKVARSILKYSIPISPLRQRTLRVTWDSEVGMIQKIECFRAKRNLLPFS